MNNIDKERQRISKAEDTVSETHLQAILNTVIDGIITIDADGVMQSVNPAAEHLFGYMSTEMLGQNVNMLMPEPYRSAHDGYLQNYLTTGIKKILGIGREVVGKRKDGTIFPMELAVTEMEIGGARMFTGIVRDISERKDTERALAEQAEKLQQAAKYERSHGRILELFNSSFDRDSILQQALSVLAKDHGFPVLAIYLNDEWQGVLQCAAAYGVPKDFSGTVAAGEGLVGQAAAENRMLLIEGRREMPLKIEAGIFSLTPAAVLAAPIVYRQQMLGVLVLSSLRLLNEQERDFIKRFTRQLGVALNSIRQYQDLESMAEQIKARGKEISQKNAQLEQANRLKNEFLANMSHELRTPLNAIIGFSEILKDGLVGKLTMEQQDYVGDIFTSANHLLSLINDILDLSKIEAGKMELLLEPVDLKPLLENALTVVKERAYAHSINLQLQLPECLGTILVDPRKFKQILFNLLTNAVKFTPDGGKVTLAAELKGENLRISVTDTGIGIAEGHLGKLFQPFEQLDGSLSRKFEGTGLGLVMVKRLVELHGGNVSVSSQPGQGSCFVFEIPWHNEQDPVLTQTVVSVVCEQPKIVFDASIQNNGKNLILLVEDEPQAAELFKHHLNSAGYLVDWVTNGKDALEYVTDRLPSLIMLDILLPDLDGWEILRRLKQDKQLAAIPVMVVSIVAERKKGLELGAIEVMEKPVPKKELFAALQRILPDRGRISHRSRILVVDDEPKSVEFVAAQLTASGYGVLKAYGGQQALEMARNELPDLLILDLMMPDVTGFDVLASLRTDKRTAEIPVIILTAKLLTEEDQQQLKENVSLVLEKFDFDDQAFLNDVARVLTSKQESLITSRESDVKILVVEDGHDQAQLLRNYLSNAGYQVILAHNGTEALELMTDNRPDLITLDLLMPEMDGYAFLEAKANQAEFTTIPVIVISSVEDELDSDALAVDALMRKPIRRSELLQAIENLLPAVPDAAGKFKILLVDDDPKVTKLIASYLSPEVFEVFKAYGGSDGLELAQAEVPDLIILDLMMPDMSGFDVLLSLKAGNRTRDIPVIILSAKVLSEWERQQLEKQVVTIAEKGKVSREKLLLEIERILKRRCP